MITMRSVAPVVAALDAERMSERLRRLLGEDAVVTRAELVEATKSRRAVVRYRLKRAGPERAIFGKVHPDAEHATRAFRTMELLAEEVFSSREGLRVTRPVGLLPELAMVLYWPTEGVTLDRLPPERAAPWVRAAAQWLALLHDSRVRLGLHFDLANETTNLREWATLVGRALPREAVAADHLARRIGAFAAELELETDVPIHKDFHYQHVIVGEGLTVIDLDEARLGDPTLDVAHFCANLRFLSLRAQTADADAAGLRDAFLEEYADLTGWQADARFTFFFAYTCLKMAKQLATGRGPRPIPTGAERARQALTVLGEGLACLAS
jgi:aminoglycoside phosphotransferase (APT) family kinase protein